MYKFLFFFLFSIVNSENITTHFSVHAVFKMCSFKIIFKSTNNTENFDIKFNYNDITQNRINIDKSSQHFGHFSIPSRPLFVPVYVKPARVFYLYEISHHGLWHYAFYNHTDDMILKSNAITEKENVSIFDNNNSLVANFTYHSVVHWDIDIIEPNYLQDDVWIYSVLLGFKMINTFYRTGNDNVAYVSPKCEPSYNNDNDNNHKTLVFITISFCILVFIILVSLAGFALSRRNANKKNCGDGEKQSLINS